MRIVVTGGLGFIGSALVNSLLDENHSVLILDNLSTGSMENLHPWAGFRKMDITNPEAADLIMEFKPDAVVHLAAQVSVTQSVKDPQEDWRINVEGTRNVVSAARSAGAKRVIIASTAAIYGNPEVIPTPEGSPKQPTNPYGESKLESEKVLKKELDGSDVDYAVVRFSNVYGPRQSTEGEGGVVALFCKAIAEGKAPVFFGDGQQTRDFVYVGDVVGAITKALDSETPLAGEDGYAYNVSTGAETTLEMMLLSLRAISGFVNAVEHAPAREEDVLRSALDPHLAEKSFGWKSAISLEKGMETTWSWFSRRTSAKNGQ